MDALFTFSRWGDEPRYRAIERRPGHPLVLPAARDVAGIVQLEVHFAACAVVDVAALLAPADHYELGRQHQVGCGAV